MASRIRVRMWRICRPEKGPGLMVWFDPECEEPALFELQEPRQMPGVPAVTDGDGRDGSGRSINIQHELF